MSDAETVPGRPEPPPSDAPASAPESFQETELQPTTADRGTWGSWREVASSTGIILAEGDRLGKCRIEQLLGSGGMGAVFLAQHETLQVPVAVKVLPPLLASKNPTFTERFLREARLAARVKHPNVVGVMDADRDPGRDLHYIVFEYVDGGSLLDRMRRGRPSVALSTRVALEIARALEAIHAEGIIHRDIKPGNILLDRKRGARLADLGLACQLVEEDTRLTAGGITLGSPVYMSPEQAKTPLEADGRTDIYSLGATLFESLTGQPPFQGGSSSEVIARVVTERIPPPIEVCPDVPRPLSDLCLAMTEPDRRARPRSVAEVVRELEWLQRGDTSVASGATTVHGSPPPPRAAGRPPPPPPAGTGTGTSTVIIQQQSPLLPVLLAVCGVLLLVLLLLWQPWSTPEPPTTPRPGPQPGQRPFPPPPGAGPPPGGPPGHPPPRPGDGPRLPPRPGDRPQDQRPADPNR
jgi:serine/threonine-protein kinase